MISNNFTGIGRITKTPEIRKTADGKSVLDFSIAINRPFVKDKDHPMADFVDCTAWGNTADNIAKYFDKGSRIGVSGRVQIDNFEDKEGVKRKSWKVQVESFEFIESKKNSSTESTSNDTDYSPVDEDANESDLPF